MFKALYRQELYVQCSIQAGAICSRLYTDRSYMSRALYRQELHVQASVQTGVVCSSLGTDRSYMFKERSDRCRLYAGDDTRMRPAFISLKRRGCGGCIADAMGEVDVVDVYEAESSISGGCSAAGVTCPGLTRCCHIGVSWRL